MVVLERLYYELKLRRVQFPKVESSIWRSEFRRPVNDTQLVFLCGFQPGHPRKLVAAFDAWHDLVYGGYRSIYIHDWDNAKWHSLSRLTISLEAIFRKQSRVGGPSEPKSKISSAPNRDTMGSGCFFLRSACLQNLHQLLVSDNNVITKHVLKFSGYRVNDITNACFMRINDFSAEVGASENC